MTFKMANTSEIFILLCGKNKKLPDLHKNLIDLNAETANSRERGCISELVREDSIHVQLYDLEYFIPLQRLQQVIQTVKYFSLSGKNKTKQKNFCLFQKTLTGPSNPYEMNFYSMTNIGRLR